MSEIALLKVFEGMPDGRRKQGRRHSLQLCLALFTLAVAAGNQGFLAIGDWLNYHAIELKELFGVERIPSYSTVRRALLETDYREYAARIAQFFEITPKEKETVSLDGKTLRGSYQVNLDGQTGDSHPAIVLVSGYVVERGLTLEPYGVTPGSNEVTALPKFIKKLALSGVVFAFDAINTQKND
ncbi:MAG: transposase family protein [Chloroflexaceae bacterium]|nr:transposase family protein [Chloroflexaceae bacterium]